MNEPARETLQVARAAALSASGDRTGSPHRSKLLTGALFLFVGVRFSYQGVRAVGPLQVGARRR
jgi:hypothetical protein